ncbi:hypothetical protein AB9K32_07830 [Allomuricauda sp. XS_ASV26]|uniref:hypothetical protein n=1 Tax=Allomuricauda sp. XS_ASV26 TaxID=3241292 RepID=UPI003513EAC0
MSKINRHLLGTNKEFILIELEKLSEFVKNNNHSSINSCYTHPLFFHLALHLDLYQVPIKRNGINRFILSDSIPTKELEVSDKKNHEHIFEKKKLIEIDIVPFVKEVIASEVIRPSPKFNAAYRDRENGLSLFRKDFDEWEMKYRSLFWRNIKKHRNNLELKIGIVEGCISYLSRSIEVNNKLYDFIEELKIYLGEIHQLKANSKPKVKVINSEKVELLKNIGFYELPTIKELSPNNKDKIVTMIVTRMNSGKKVSRPYLIALLFELGYKNLFNQQTKTLMYRVTADLLDTHPRTISGNFAVLNSESQDRGKFTSHTHTESVKNYLKELN